MDIGIPANSSRKIVWEQPGFSVTYLTAGTVLYLRINGGRKQPIASGQKIGGNYGDNLGNLVFINESSSAIDITLSDYAIDARKIDSDVPQFVPDADNQFAAEQGGFHKNPVAPQPTIALDPLRPYRRIWAFYDDSTFANGDGAQLVFYLQNVIVLTVPLDFKSATAEWGFGSTVNSELIANRQPTDDSIFYKNDDGTGKFYQIKPIRRYVYADTVNIERVQGSGAAGTVRAFLYVSSTKVLI